MNKEVIQKNKIHLKEDTNLSLYYIPKYQTWSKTEGRKKLKMSSDQNKIFQTRRKEIKKKNLGNIVSKYFKGKKKNNKA